jgi:hypothetical protein
MILDRVKIVPWYYGQVQVVATQNIKKSDVILIEDPLIEIEKVSFKVCISLLKKLLDDKEKLTEFMSWNLRKDHDKPFFILKIQNNGLQEIINNYDFDIRSIFKLIIINAIDFDNKSGLYKIASRINHSCIPNCKQEEDKSRRFTALRNIREGEPITYNYLNDTEADYFSKQVMLYFLGFMCKCDICKGIFIPGLKNKIIEACRNINEMIEVDW